MKKRKRKEADLPEKANKILNGILVVLILVAIKVWHLSVIQHDKKEEEAKRPQRRVIVERSERAAIYDRFGIPLAANKVQYNAAICYGPIRELPRTSWKKNEQGKRVKFSLRKEYIATLSKKLADELFLDAEWIEDLIHSKAAILGNVPCILKENITENQYFKLKMLEMEWPGIHAEIGAKRCYPLGEVGGEVIGYIGPISMQEYDSITKEMAALRQILNDYEDGEQEIALEGFRSVQEVAIRLEELEKKAYHINDFVGKAGVEATFDEALRGLSGKQIYLADIRGNFLRKLPGSHDPTPGSRLVLTLSAELQEYAQKLLASYDSEPPSSLPSVLKKRALIPENQPWIKGGAILAMDPNSGEVYAMASYPSFDPNDFIRAKNSPEFAEKNNRVKRWLETEGYLADVWDMKVPFSRPRYDEESYEETLELSWEAYLRFILPKSSAVRAVLEEKNTLGDSIKIQRKIDQLTTLFTEEKRSMDAAKILNFLYREGDSIPVEILTTLQDTEFLEARWQVIEAEALAIREELEPYFSTLPLNYEKLLLVDLYRLLADATYFSPYLTDLLGEMALSDYRDASARFVCVFQALQALVKEIFLENDFKGWREENFKDYLAERRKEEKEANKKYARPYVEYLEQARSTLFATFWEKNQWEFMTLLLTGKIEESDPALVPYTMGIKNWADELKAGAHQGLDWVHHFHKLCMATDDLEHKVVIYFLKTLRSFDQLSRPLLGRYSGLRGGKEKHLAAAFYPTYGFGFARSHAFRQATTIGSIFKLVPAYEALRQRYLGMKERGESIHDLNPLTIIDDKHRVWGKNNTWNVGFTLDGRPIPHYYRGGMLPRTEHSGVGKVDLVRALEASSNPYFAMLVGDVLDDPEDLCEAANLFGYGEKTLIDLPGEYAGRIPKDVSYNRTGLYTMSIGQHSLVGTPLQTAVMLSSIVNGGAVLKPQIVKEEPSEVRWRVFLPLQIQQMLLSGMRQVIFGEKGTARILKKQFDSHLISQIIGKTSTAEVMEKMSLDGNDSRLKLKHVWFGGISYELDNPAKPELVVIVYLRFGNWGWNAAPLAVEIIKKWRELKSKYQTL